LSLNLTKSKWEKHSLVNKQKQRLRERTKKIKKMVESFFFFLYALCEQDDDGVRKIKMMMVMVIK